ncbi:hypothetical protein RI129_004653 [Pyrocoelia pectoralis]|uniref:Uncharacterized protein n=1 Tax=Pyrocoelia pectoralis TaxID=417401 RepID=A0AAN7VLX9_9COLE
MEIVLQIPRDLNKLCRTCMSLIDEETENFVISQNEKTDLSKMLQKVTSLKISVSDGLPPSLCSRCVHQLNTAYTFINQCTEVDNNLRKILKDAYSSDNECVEILDTTSSYIKLPTSVLSCKDCEASFTSYYDLTMHAITHNRTRSLTERFVDNCAEGKYNIDLPHTSSTEVKVLIDETRNRLETPKLNDIKMNINNIKEETFDWNAVAENNLQCDTCQRKFQTESQLSTHIRLHCDKFLSKKQTCTLCFKEFDDLSSVSLHFLNHSLSVEVINSESIFSEVSFCDFCGQIFDNDTLLSTHYDEVHPNKQNWECLECAVAFHKEKDLLTHNLVLHQDHEVYETEYKAKTQCVLCTEKFSTKAEMHNHSLAHLMKRYTCRKCSLIFCTQHSLFAHLEVHTGKKYECSLCGKYLSSRSALRSHVQGVHPNNLEHCCSICGKCFATFARLSTHSKIHTTEKKYICSYCGYSSHKSGDLAMHTRIHTSERPYKCTVPNCTMSFKTSSHLCHHVRRHFQIRKFKCDICAMKFSTNHGLKIHQMLHTGEKPHLCIVCKKTFRRKYHLKVHMRQHVEHNP